MIIFVECNSAPQELEPPYKCSANPGIGCKGPSSGRESVPSLVGWVVIDGMINKLNMRATLCWCCCCSDD